MGMQAPDRPQIEVPPNVAEVHEFLPEVGGYLVTLKESSHNTVEIQISSTIPNPYSFTSDRDGRINSLLAASLSRGQGISADAAPILLPTGQIVYMMIDGNKRRHIMELQRLDKIKCRILLPKTKKEVLIEQFEANRINTGNYAMSIFTRAQAIKQIIDMETAEGNKNPVQTVATATRQSAETVENYLALLNAPAEIQDSIRRRALAAADFYKIIGQSRNLPDFDLKRALQYLLERLQYESHLKPSDIREAIASGTVAEDRVGRPPKAKTEPEEAKPQKTPEEIAIVKTQIAEGQTTLLEYIRANTEVLDRDVEQQVIECLAEPDTKGKKVPMKIVDICKLIDIAPVGHSRINAVSHVLNNSGKKLACIGLTVRKITNKDKPNLYELVFLDPKNPSTDRGESA